MASRAPHPRKPSKKSPKIAGSTTPKELFKAIRQIYGWSNRSQMATGLGLGVNELSRVERGELALSADVKERLMVLGVHPDTFEMKDGIYTQKLPLNVTTGTPLTGPKPFGPNTVNLGLLHRQVSLTLYTALNSTKDPATRLLILHRVQQCLNDLPRVHQVEVIPPWNVIEMHHAAVALGLKAVVQYYIDNPSTITSEPGAARKVRRRKNGLGQMLKDAQARLEELEHDYQAALALSGPTATAKEVESVLYYGIQRLLAQLKQLETKSNPAQVEARDLWQKIFNTLPSPIAPLPFVEPDWVAEDLFSRVHRRQAN